MARIIFILVLCIFCFASGFSQVEIKEDFPIDKLVDQYITVNNSKQFIDGWRIQIMAKTDRRDIEQAKESFILEFPEFSVDWTHSKPYYRLRAGAFRTKLDAIRMIQFLKEKYPGAFPVKDDISKQELLPSM